MKFLSEDLWPSIRRLADEPGRKYVAVPYVSVEAAKRLRLKKGDVLVTRFDDENIKNGRVSPAEILKYLRREVEVHHWDSLHAKVYVSNRRAIVGSANVSASSEERLTEAGVVSTDRKFVATARRFVEGLRGQAVGPDWATQKLSLYRPPKGLPGRTGTSRRKRSGMWVVNVRLRDRTPEAERAAGKALKRAERTLKEPDKFSLDDVDYSVDWKVMPGDWVVQHVHDGRDKYFEAPARVSTVERYLSLRKAQHQVVVLESRKHSRTRKPKAVIAALRKSGVDYKVPKQFRQIKRDLVRRTLFSIWPNVSETAD